MPNNIGAFGENFPYTNQHDMNQDWLIKIAKDFLDQYSHIEETLATGLTDLTEKAEELEGLLQQWYDTHSVELQQQIATALANAIQTFNSTATATGQTVLNTIPGDYSSLWLSIAETFSATKDYVKGQIVKTTDNNGTGHVWKFTSNHTAGTWNPSEATEINLGDGLENISIGAIQKLNNFNVKNLIDNMSFSESTDRGITFSPVGLGIKVSGESTAQAYTDIFYGNTPTYIDLTKKYYIDGGNDSRIHLQVLTYNDQDVSSIIYDNYNTQYVSFPIPENAVKIRIRIRVMSTNTPINTIIYPAIREVMTNNELTSIANRYSSFNIVNPDTFNGTDTEKLQSAFDVFDRTGGGVILIGRNYTMTDEIYIKHQTFDEYNNRITVIGIGENAGINTGAYSIYGYDENERNHGGITFKNLHFTGIYKLFDVSKLLRITMENCTIENYNYIAFGYPYMQSMQFINCLFRDISTACFKMRNEENASMFDILVDGCTIENCNSVLDCYRGYEVRIINSCIEAITGIPIHIKNHAGNIVIEGNYFEHNNDGFNPGSTAGNATHIDLSLVNNQQAVNIIHNYFSQDNSLGVIILPTNDVENKGFIRIESNYFLGENQVAIKATQGTNYKDVILSGNNGIIENYNNVFPYSDKVTYTNIVNFNRTGKIVELNAVGINLTGNSGWTLVEDNIPEGYIPSTQLVFPSFDSTGNMVKTRLNTNGTLEVYLNNTSSNTIDMHCTYSM